MIEPGAGNDNHQGPPLADLIASEEARTVEALIFASATPVSVGYLAERLPAGADVEAILRALDEKRAEAAADATAPAEEASA